MTDLEFEKIIKRVQERMLKNHSFSLEEMLTTGRSAIIASYDPARGATLTGTEIDFCCIDDPIQEHGTATTCTNEGEGLTLEKLEEAMEALRKQEILERYKPEYLRTSFSFKERPEAINMVRFIGSIA